MQLYLETGPLKRQPQQTTTPAKPKKQWLIEERGWIIARLEIQRPEIQSYNMAS